MSCHCWSSFWRLCLQAGLLARIAVDEVHCASAWGQVCQCVRCAHLQVCNQLGTLHCCDYVCEPGLWVDGQHVVHALACCRTSGQTTRRQVPGMRAFCTTAQAHSRFNIGRDSAVGTPLLGVPILFCPCVNAAVSAAHSVQGHTHHGTHCHCNTPGTKPHILHQNAATQPAVVASQKYRAPANLSQ